MTISSEGLELIASFEGFSSKPYKDPAGIWTIGYGNTYLLNGAKVSQNTPPVSRQEALQLFQGIIAELCSSVNKLLTVGLKQGQYDACISLAYNIGIGNFKKSRLLRNINAGIPVTKENFLSWNTAKGVVLPGLTARRLKEFELYQK